VDFLHQQDFRTTAARTKPFTMNELDKQAAKSVIIATIAYNGRTGFDSLH
jgi:hypothetical protein